MKYFIYIPGQKENKTKSGITVMRKLILGIILFLLFGSIRANNIAVTNVRLMGQDTTAGANNSNNFCFVDFGVSWSNSWRTSYPPFNWDAAWVFVKFRWGTTDPVFTGISSGTSTTITVSSTANLRVGMVPRVTSGSGQFASGTIIQSIISATQFQVSATPSSSLSGATITCVRVWEHASLNTSGHEAPAGGTVDIGLNTAGNAGVGAFIYRKTDGNGDIDFSRIKLRWNYGSQNIRDTDRMDINVYAIEMVYVPQGAFQVGDVTTNTDGAFCAGNSATSPFTISSENALTLGGSSAENLSNADVTNMSTDDDFSTSTTKTLPAAYPKGYNAFYCMKYEITQKQYVDFLNALTRVQQSARVATSISVGTTSVTNRYVMLNSSTSANRNGIRCPGSISSFAPVTFYCDLSGNGTGNESNDGQWIACNYLNWTDITTYLDWAGLRPMTELEYEKACRGFEYPVSSEYVWGNTTISTTSSIVNSGMVTETGGNGNIVLGNRNNVQGPMRVGLFAKSSTSTRSETGATYFGIMEMGGNVCEAVVPLGSATPRNFTGTNGNGSISNAGAFNESWPASASSGQRGSDWSDPSTSNSLMSCRIFANTALSSRSGSTGGRGIRTAP